jgi:hypothetical protein
VKNKKSKWLIVGISLVIGGLHFLIGPNYQGPFRTFMNSYLIDILLPMNVYLLSQLGLRGHMSLVLSRVVGGLGTFSVGMTVEFMQYLGIDFLGTTFDPWDLLMYALGILTGLGIDFGILDSWENP